MNIGVAYENGRIAKNLGDCREVLIITTEGREPVGKRIAEIAGTSATDLIKFAGHLAAGPGLHDRRQGG